MSRRPESDVRRLAWRRQRPNRASGAFRCLTLIGTIAPVILIPTWLARDPNRAKLDWALRHELMHWKLFDPIAGLVRELAQILFYGTPILYTVQTVADHHLFGIPFSRILVLNPLGAILTQARKALLDPNAPSAARAIGGNARLLIPLAITGAMFALGLWFFNREAPRISENL